MDDSYLIGSSTAYNRDRISHSYSFLLEAEAMAEVLVNPETTNKRKGKKSEDGPRKSKKKGMTQTTLDRWLFKPRPATRIRFDERVVLKIITPREEILTDLPLKWSACPSRAFAKKRKEIKQNMAHNHYWRRQKLTPRNVKRVLHVLERMRRENTKLGY